MRQLILLLTLVALTLNSLAQRVIPLYKGAIPNAKPTNVQETAADKSSQLIRRVLTPTLEAYLPAADKATGTAVVICAGGGYKVIVYEGEGINTAKALAQQGIAAFELRYRLPNDTFVVDPSIAPLQDAQQAIKLVRDSATQWGVHPGRRIGIMGFSAGGHLAAITATRFQHPLIENKSGTSLRPDFAILVYPVISMQDSLTHRDSRSNLLGSHPSKAIIDQYSNELQVSSETPPTYLTHTSDDEGVPVNNSILFYEALQKHKVAAEMHLYVSGGHGFIFKKSDWLQPVLEWMQQSKYINQIYR